MDAKSAEEGGQALPEPGDEKEYIDNSVLGSEHSRGGTSVTTKIPDDHWSGERPYKATKDTARSMPSDDKQFESIVGFKHMSSL